MLAYNDCTDEFCNLDDQGADEVAQALNLQSDTGLTAFLGCVPQRLQINPTSETVSFYTSM